jgi:hypothetical protein
MRDALVAMKRPPSDGPDSAVDGGLISGRYRPLRPLGSGGSGSVWLARDERSSRDVALKAVRREGKAASRAEREVEAAARLRHPRCLRALALERDDAHVYVAYEYVRGRTLRDAIRSGELDDGAAVEAAAQMLEGLAHAHAKGVVHRDVKPANVMLADDGEDVSVRLLDFGLAHLDEADTLTAAGDVPGTLAYIAPERLAGRTACGAADVWAVGVVLWEALAGWHPFAAASPVETARRIAAGPEPLARMRPDLPSGLCALVDRMLTVDPSRRPAAKRLPDALRDALAERARRPRPATSLHALRRRGAHAALSGVFAGASAAVLPFFPNGWPFALAALTALLALRAPRAGLAFALAVPVLPLGNAGLGLALVYAVAALGWAAVFLRDARAGLLFAAGPLLAPVAGLGLLPVVALRARGPVRRALTAGTGVLAAGALAALAGIPFALGGDVPAADAALGGTESPGGTLAALGGILAAEPALPLLALVFSLAALAAPLARAQGVWGVAGWGAAFLAAAVLGPSVAGTDSVRAVLLTPGVWAATLLLGAEALGLRPGRLARLPRRALPALSPRRLESAEKA